MGIGHLKSWSAYEVFLPGDDSQLHAACNWPVRLRRCAKPAIRPWLLVEAFHVDLLLMRLGLWTAWPLVSLLSASTRR